MTRSAPDARLSGLRSWLGPARGGLELPLAIFVAGVCALVVVAATTRLSSPAPLAALLVVVLAIALVGTERVIAVGLLLGCGLLPFLQPANVAAGGFPYWLLGFVLAAGLMVGMFVARLLADEPIARVQPSLLLWLALVLLVFSTLRMAQSSPFDVKSAAAPFVVFPLAVIVTFLWLLHERTLEMAQRTLPIVVAVVGAWTVMYIFGSTGKCAPCSQWVGTLSTGEGLLGPTSRLYTWGQQAQLGFVLLAVACAMRRPTRFWVVLAGLGLLSILLENSRAQEVAVFGGLIVLLIWRLYHLPVVTKVLTAALFGLAAYAVISSSIGAHIVSGYQGLSEGTGTGSYRLNLLDAMRPHWTWLGQGVSFQSLDLGYDIDLGVPNTILIIGYLGAALQIGLLAAGVGRALLARSSVGVALASVLVMVLLARPSLPFLETGMGAVAYGVALGVVASLYVRSAAERRQEREQEPVAFGVAA